MGLTNAQVYNRCASRATFARVSSFISLTPSNPAKLISSSISTFHYRAHSHGTGGHANEQEKLREAIPQSHFQSSIIYIYTSSPSSTSSFALLSFFLLSNSAKMCVSVCKVVVKMSNMRQHCINSLDKNLDVGRIGCVESCRPR